MNRRSQSEGGRLDRNRLKDNLRKLLQHLEADDQADAEAERKSFEEGTRDFHAHMAIEALKGDVAQKATVLDLKNLEIKVESLKGWMWKAALTVAIGGILALVNLLQRLWLMYVAAVAGP